jgi:hypothetical protein
MDGESENPDETRLASELCRGKRLSFGYFSLQHAKKSDSRKARKRLDTSADR